MAKNLVQNGHTITFVAAAAVSSGQAVVVGDMITVSHGDVAIGEAGEGHAVGVFNLPKTAAADIAQGASVYLKDGEIGIDETGVYAGKAWEPAGNGVTSVPVSINAGSVVPAPAA